MTQEAAGDDARAQPKGPSIWKKITERLGLNVPIVLMMAKYVASEAPISVNQIGTYTNGNLTGGQLHRR